MLNEDCASYRVEDRKNDRGSNWIGERFASTEGRDSTILSPDSVCVWSEMWQVTRGIEEISAGEAISPLGLDSGPDSETPIE
jgi:hypothetical protein